MKELYRIIVERNISRTSVAGFETISEAIEYLKSILSDDNENFDSATIEKYIQ